ncbi:MAG: DUF4406 domain-containing protein [Marivivens sp.]|nr:DUF4406 domain-containing protein [Marivivens sp.]NBT50013.1 DUF4406 domain-containing protein [Marivivens sp.]NCW67039.1 DUF4406 domain-containing protein [Marivivens sp.]NDH01540.1 DUF4406 domain-containing protein [Marivivens sp.]
MRIYIAGPMRKYEFFNHPAFHEAEQHLISLGYEVVSPARLDIEAGFALADLPDNHDWNEMPPGMDYEETMTRDLAALDTCDAIYMLRGWTTSQGARREQLHAAATKRHVFFEQDVLEPPDVSTVKESLTVQAAGPLPTDKQARKETPLYSGLLMYFPKACAAVAQLSYAANEQHNPGEPMHWAREKSSDHPDCLMRHLIEAGTIDDDGQRHTAKVAWRALAMLELELEGAK